MNSARTILHVDMDAFFASIEQMDNPALKGKPVLVGHDGPRGVVSAASYEARKFGCHSAQPMVVAKRLCPHAVIVSNRQSRYGEVSRSLFIILSDFSPLVEPLSVDEAFLDLTGTERALGTALVVANKLKARIRTELGLTASVGIAPNKFLAKLASDMQKPDGLVVIPPEDIQTILRPLPVTKLWGIGPATAARLDRVGIRTVGHLQERSVEQLQKLLGNDADWFHRLSHGIDDRPVVPDREAKSIGQEQTFEVDCSEAETVRRVLFEQVEQVGQRLRKHGLFARTVTLKLRYGDFETITRSTTLGEATNVTAELWKSTNGIFEKWVREHFQPVRLIGATASQLSQGDEPSLFVDQTRERQMKLDAIADKIVARFGKGSMRRGGGMNPASSEPPQEQP